MNKLLYIKKIMPDNVQILVRNDIESGGWFIHFYTKAPNDEDVLVKGDTIIKKYCGDYDVDNVLSSIVDWCLSNKKEGNDSEAL